MNHPVRIGIVGLDTSHVTAFTTLLHETDHSYHVPGGKVVIAYPGGSPDFELSVSRVKQFTEELQEKYGVRIVGSPAEVAEQCDAILLESVDGRVHPEQFREIVSFGKPVFVDKPFALNSAQAAEMMELAKKHRTPLMSCSALRYAEAFLESLDQPNKGTVIGCDTFGPMAIQPTQPGLFWYGIHSVEMLFAVLGKQCVSVTVHNNDDFDFALGVWEDGRIGTVRGNRKGNDRFGALIHRERDLQYVDVASRDKPFYASLLERVMEFFRTGRTPFDLQETLSIIRFIEAANESRLTGETVRL